MYDLDEALRKGANQFRARLAKDPTELQRRLARRQMTTLTRPPRAWCLAVRASDLRITSYRAIIEPGEAPRFHEAHRVTLDSRLLRYLCRPIRIPFPGLPAREVAQMLGMHQNHLHKARAAGVFDVKFIQGLDGKMGPATPVLYTRSYLDPGSMNLHRMADVMWGTVHRHVSEHVPDGIEQEIKRVPLYGKGCHYGEEFRGWRWVCPECGKLARVIYFPLGRLYSVRLRLPAKLGVMERKIKTPEPAKRFMCESCHQIQVSINFDSHSWNTFIAQLTGGLLYGSEVEKPEGFVTRRQRNYRPQVNREAPRRQRALELLLAGKTVKEIREGMGLSDQGVFTHIRAIYAQERVKDRHELARKLGVKGEQPLNLRERGRERRERVKEMLLEGMRNGEMAKRLGMNTSSVCYLMRKVYEEHGVRGWGLEGRREFAEKMGVRLPATRMEMRRERIAELRERGMGWSAIAREMGMPVSTVYNYAKRLGDCRAGMRGVFTDRVTPHPSAMFGACQALRDGLASGK